MNTAIHDRHRRTGPVLLGGLRSFARISRRLRLLWPKIAILKNSRGCSRGCSPQPPLPPPRTPMTIVLISFDADAAQVRQQGADQPPGCLGPLPLQVDQAGPHVVLVHPLRLRRLPRVSHGPLVGDSTHLLHPPERVGPGRVHVAGGRPGQVGGPRRSRGALRLRKTRPVDRAGLHTRELYVYGKSQKGVKVLHVISESATRRLMFQMLIPPIHFIHAPLC